MTGIVIFVKYREWCVVINYLSCMCVVFANVSQWCRFTPMDSTVECISCGQVRSRKNIVRHMGSCRTSADVQENPPPVWGWCSERVLEVVNGQWICSSLRQPFAVICNSWSSTGSIRPAPSMRPLPVVAVPRDIIRKSKSHCIKLWSWLQQRQAALLHEVVEKNSTSPDPKKRDFTAEAASTLSFWA